MQQPDPVAKEILIRPASGLLFNRFGNTPPPPCDPWEQLRVLAFSGLEAGMTTGQVSSSHA